MEHIGQLIRETRERKGLTIEDLAENASVSAKTIQRLETGKTGGRAFTLKSIAHALDIPLEMLTDFHTTKESLETVPASKNIDFLKKMNLSALVVLILPLTNLIIPTILFSRAKKDAVIKEIGSKILSFHLIWLIATSVALLIAPFARRLFHITLVTEFGSILFTYVLFWLINIFVILRIGYQLNEKREKALNGWIRII